MELHFKFYGFAFHFKLIYTQLIAFLLTLPWYLFYFITIILCPYTHTCTAGVARTYTTKKSDWAYLHLHPGSEQDHFLNAVIVAVAVAVVVNNFILFK